MRCRRVREPGATYFFTVVTHRRRPLFSDETNIERWHRAVTAVKTKRPFVVDAWVILPDHLHFMWTLPRGDADYSTRIRLIKTKFTRAIHAAHDVTARRGPAKSERTNQPVWQHRYWEHTIASDEDFGVHLDYIHINPVRHYLVCHALDWPWSSLREWIERGVYDERWGSRDMLEMSDGSWGE